MKYYVFWSNGVNSGFVDYCGDFVSDNLEERALFFDTEEEARAAIKEIKEDNPNGGALSVGEF